MTTDSDKLRIWDYHGNKMIYGFNRIHYNKNNLPYMVAEKEEKYLGRDEVFYTNFEATRSSGLRDMNHSLIYKYDIIKLIGDFKVVILFERGAFCYNPHEYSDFIGLGLNYNFKWDNNRSFRIKVIGNIYENKDLLDEYQLTLI